ncbi:hypothetical protein Ciccas_005288 [Cichlidogyrus casuarinus]|uniref:Cilia- and flagella-associated protein 58 central coiled coil domain-containing protein n=1 Tax=Cichlidogyrus casuarinus TaxID=1844966 RepID=A0ABD2Q931_9PLAT
MTEASSPKPKNQLKLAIDENTFAELEKDFDEVLQDISSNKALDKFKDEYQKVMRALKKSHESEKQLMRKCRELKAEIISNSARVSEALKLSSNDQSVIVELKQEIKKAWKMVDEASEKETKANESISTLKAEIDNLTQLIEHSSGSQAPEDTAIAELVKKRDNLEREKEHELKENQRLREQIEEARNQLSTLQNEKIEVQAKMNELANEIQQKVNETQREARKKERIEKEFKNVQAEVEAKIEEIKKSSKINQRLKGDLKLKEDENFELKSRLENSNRQMQITENKLKEVQDKFETQLMMTETMQKEAEVKKNDLKKVEEDLKTITAENQKVHKQIEITEKSIKRIEDERNVAEQNRDRMREEIKGYEREIAIFKKNMQHDKAVCEDLARERDMLSKNLLKGAEETSKQVNLVKLHEQTKRNLEHEISNYREECTKQRKVIFNLEKERDNYINEASELTQKVLSHMEDLKMREMQIFDYKKKIAESETKLKQQQNLYEAVRSDRNLYSKNLIEAQDEMTEMKRRLRIMGHQIYQLKEEVTSKEARLVKENIEKQRIEKHKEQLNLELRKVRAQAAENKTFLESQEAECRKLEKVITEADAEVSKQKKELAEMMSQRDIVGSQLVRRNDELSLLYEKIRIQKAILDQGESQYNQRLEDIRVLKLEICRLRHKKTSLQVGAEKTAKLKREVVNLEKELLKQRTRCKALEEELENPINVHRWRRLEGSDPTAFEMIMKVQTLQKHVVAKHEEIVEKEMMIQEKEKLYLELKQILMRQPGPEVAEQLVAYKTTLKNKTEQIQALNAEMNMYDSQIKDYKFEIDRLMGELGDMKKRYFNLKKSRAQEKPKKSLKAQAKILGDRFAGGGFNLGTQQSETVKEQDSKFQGVLPNIH